MNGVESERCYEWAELVDVPALPSFAQVHRWAARGLLGPDKVGLGSGGRRTWTDHEVAKLQALGELCKDLTGLGLMPAGIKTSGVPLPLVERLWPALDDEPSVTIRCGGVAVTVSLGPGVPGADG